MPDFENNDELSVSPASQESGDDSTPGGVSDSPKAADKKRRTTVSLSISGDDYDWVTEGASRLGVTQAKFILDFAKEGHRIHNELLRAMAEDFEGSFLHAQMVGMETRHSESIQQLQENINMIGFMLNVLMSQIDAKTKWDLVTTPELSEESRAKLVEKAPERYDSLIKATVRGVDDNGQSVFADKIIQEIDNRSARNE